MPINAPEIVVAINLSRKVGTPEASAASSSSRMVAKPKPSCVRAIVREMTIESHDASVDIIGSEPEKWKPETRETADHSLPYITAIALIDGEVTEKQFQPERFKDLAVWKFLENVKVERNAELSALYPNAVANIVHADLADGRRLTRRVDYPTGHAKNPLKDSQVEEKFNVLVDPMLARDRARKILDIVWKLDGAEDVNELMKAAK